MSKNTEISMLRLYAWKNRHTLPKLSKIMHKIANRLEKEHHATN